MFLAPACSFYFWSSSEKVTMSSCTYCDKVFSTNFNCKRHEKRFHCNFTNECAEGKGQIGYGVNEEIENSLHGSEDSDDSSYGYHTERDSGDESCLESSEESDENGQENETDSEEEKADLWDHMVLKVYREYQDEYDDLVNNFEDEGYSKESAKAAAHNSLLKQYRKSLREQLVALLVHVKMLKTDPIFRKIMKTKRNLTDLDDYDEEEALECAVKKRKFLLNRLIQPIDVSSSEHESTDEGENA